MPAQWAFAEMLLLTRGQHNIPKTLHKKIVTIDSRADFHYKTGESPLEKRAVGCTEMFVKKAARVAAKAISVNHSNKGSSS